MLLDVTHFASKHQMFTNRFDHDTLLFQSHLVFRTPASVLPQHGRQYCSHMQPATDGFRHTLLFSGPCDPPLSRLLHSPPAPNASDSCVRSSKTRLVRDVDLAVGGAVGINDGDLSFGSPSDVWRSVKSS